MCVCVQTDLRKASKNAAYMSGQLWAFQDDVTYLRAKVNEWFLKESLRLMFSVDWLHSQFYWQQSQFCCHTVLSNAEVSFTDTKLSSIDARFIDTKVSSTDISFIDTKVGSTGT